MRAAARQRGTKINVSADDEKRLSEGQVALSNADISCTSCIYTAYSRDIETNARVQVTLLLLWPSARNNTVATFPVRRDGTALLKAGSQAECYVH
jgi:hypothetical protein